MNTIFSALFFFSPARALPLTAQRDFHPPRDVTPPGRTDGRTGPAVATRAGTRGACFRLVVVDGAARCSAAPRHGWGGRGVVVREEDEDDDGDGRREGAGGPIGPTSAENPTLLTPAFLHLLRIPSSLPSSSSPSLSSQRHQRHRVVTVVRSAREFPFSPMRTNLARLKDRALFLSLSLASGGGSRLRISLPSAPRVDNSLPRARPAEFCLSSPSPPSSLFLSLSLDLVLSRDRNRPLIASFSPTSLMMHTRCQLLEAASSNVTNATTMTGVRPFLSLLREVYFCVV